MSAKLPCPLLWCLVVPSLVLGVPRASAQEPGAPVPSVPKAAAPGMPSTLPPPAPSPAPVAAFAVTDGIGNGPAAAAERDRFWGSFEYVLWWINAGGAPPLVTTSPAGSPFSTAGVVGAANTSVLIGGNLGDYGPLSGFRLTGGFWFDDAHTLGLEARGFLTAVQASRAAESSGADGTPILARPVLSTVSNDETALFIAFPGTFSGNISINSTSRLYGAEINLMERLPCCGPLGAVNVLFGVRYAGFNEDLNIVQSSTVLGGGVVGFEGATVTAPNGVRIRDSFDVRNEFYGLQAGLNGRYEMGNLALDMTGKLAVGPTQQLLTVAGSTEMLTPAGVGGVASGGLLALPSNIGRRINHQISLMPEAELKLDYRFSPHVSASIGYDFLYWAQVIRPGEQIDRTVNPALQPTSLSFGTFSGAARPNSVYTTSNGGLTLQGLTFGVAFRY